MLIKTLSLSPPPLCSYLNNYDMQYRSLPTALAKDYRFRDGAHTRVIVPVISSEVMASSDDWTVGADMTLDEEMTIQYTIAIPESIVPNTTVSITIPDGMALLNSSIISIGDLIFNSTLLAGDEHGELFYSNFTDDTNTSVTLWLHFGELFNLADNIWLLFRKQKKKK